METIYPDCGAVEYGQVRGSYDLIHLNLEKTARAERSAVNCERDAANGYLVPEKDYPHETDKVRVGYGDLKGRDRVEDQACQDGDHHADHLHHRDDGDGEGIDGSHLRDLPLRRRKKRKERAGCDLCTSSALLSGPRRATCTSAPSPRSPWRTCADPLMRMEGPVS